MYFVISVYEESYKRANMKPMSKEVKQRRQKMIGHILKQDQNSDCNIAVTWVTEGTRRKGRPKITWRRLVEKERTEQDGNRGRNWRP